METDVLVVGAGVIGLSIAIAILEQDPAIRLLVLEKENSLGKHASGRNSGVIHAGFYYSPDSLKAKFCASGNQALRQLCKEHGIPIRTVGKVVVAKNERELNQLVLLFNRGLENGVQLELLPASQLPKYEPLAQTFGSFIWSPTTAVSDPDLVLSALHKSAEMLGAKFIFGERPVIDQDTSIALVNGETISFKHIINAAGTQADRIAHQFGFGRNLAMLPFMGVYRSANHSKLPLATLVYPVPDPSNPFLGVHLTISVHGRVKIGPTAIPILNREQYHLFNSWNVRDIGTSVAGFSAMFRGDFHNLAKLAFNELPKVFLKRLVRDAATLVPEVKKVSGWEPMPPGIRAQLVNLKTGELISDFILQGDAHSTHVLNAVSPGWTAAIPFGRYVAERVLKDM